MRRPNLVIIVTLLLHAAGAIKLNDMRQTVITWLDNGFMNIFQTEHESQVVVVSVLSRCLYCVYTTILHKREYL